MSWTIQGACDRVFMLDRTNGDLWEILDGKMQKIVAVDGGAARQEPEVRRSPAEALLGGPQGLDRFPTWSGEENDRNLFVGQDVVEIGGVTYVGQVQPITPEAQPSDEIAKAGPCELIVMEWDTKEVLKKVQTETRVEAWQLFDDWMDQKNGKPVLQLEHADTEAQA